MAYRKNSNLHQLAYALEKRADFLEDAKDWIAENPALAAGLLGGGLGAGTGALVPTEGGTKERLQNALLGLLLGGGVGAGAGYLGRNLLGKLHSVPPPPTPPPPPEKKEPEKKEPETHKQLTMRDLEIKEEPKTKTEAAGASDEGYLKRKKKEAEDFNKRQGAYGTNVNSDIYDANKLKIDLGGLNVPGLVGTADAYDSGEYNLPGLAPTLNVKSVANIEREVREEERRKRESHNLLRAFGLY